MVPPSSDACKRYLIVLRYCTFAMTVALHSRHQRPLRRTGEMRWFAVAIAALVGIAHLAVLLHFVLIQHEYCAEHRHLVHSGAYQQSRAVGVSATRPNVAAVSGVEQLNGHEHCDAPLGFGKGAYLICRAGALPRALAGAREDCVVDRSRAVPPVATLSFAPKLSPPSA